MKQFIKDVYYELLKHKAMLIKKDSHYYIVYPTPLNQMWKLNTSEFDMFYVKYGIFK